MVDTSAGEPNARTQKAILEIGGILNAMTPDDRWFVLSFFAALRRSRIESLRREERLEPIGEMPR